MTAPTFESEIARLFRGATDAPRAATQEDRSVLDEQHPGWLNRALDAGLVIIVSATDAGYAAWGIHPGRVDGLAKALSEIPDGWSETAESNPPMPWDALDHFATRATRS